MSGRAGRDNHGGYLAAMTPAELSREGFDGLRFTCTCGRTACTAFGLLTTRRGIDLRRPIASVVPRCRCSACGRRSTLHDVAPWKLGDDAPGAYGRRPSFAELTITRSYELRKGES